MVLSRQHGPLRRLRQRAYDKNGNVTLEASEAGGIEQLRRETTVYDGLGKCCARQLMLA